MRKSLLSLLVILLLPALCGCPQTMIDRIEKLLPPPGYKPKYMTSNIPFDTLAKRYAEALKSGRVDTNAMYDEEMVRRAEKSDSLIKLYGARADSLSRSPIADSLLALYGFSLDSASRSRLIDSVVRTYKSARRRSATKNYSSDSAVMSVQLAPATLQMRSLRDNEYPDKIELRCSLMDSSGRVILGLAPPYLNLKPVRNYWRTLVDSCNGVAHRIDSFSVREIREAVNEPYALAFAIDHSGSMGKTRIRKLREAVRQTMNIISKGDMVCVLPFAGTVGLDVSLMADSAQYKKRFDLEKHASISGGTAIYDAVLRASVELSKAPKTHKKAILLFTDGDDNASLIGLGDACRIARDSGVVVYAVAYGITNEGPLETLSRLSGGRFYRIYSTKEFPYVFSDIYRSLKNYYQISYIPPPCKGIHNVNFSVSLPELGVKRLVGRGMYDKSLFSELDSVGSITFVNIEFESGKAVIKDSSFALIEQIALSLKSHPTISMEIRGHTDDRGSDVINARLSQQRAEAVALKLISMGVSQERLSTKGYGSTRPLVPNDSDENRAKNRRTEFVISKR